MDRRLLVAGAAIAATCATSLGAAGSAAGATVPRSWRGACRPGNVEAEVERQMLPLSHPILRSRSVTSGRCPRDAPGHVNRGSCAVVGGEAAGRVAAAEVRRRTHFASSTEGQGIFVRIRC